MIDAYRIFIDVEVAYRGAAEARIEHKGVLPTGTKFVVFPPTLTNMSFPDVPFTTSKSEVFGVSVPVRVMVNGWFPTLTWPSLTCAVKVIVSVSPDSENRDRD